MSQSSLEANRQAIEKLVAEGHNYQAIAEKYGTSRHSIRRAVKRWGLSNPTGAAEPAGMKIAGDEGTVTSKASTALPDHETLIKERGLDPNDWEVDRMTINEWDSPTGDVLRQLKVGIKRLRPLELPQPARSDGWKAPKKAAKEKGTSSLVVMVGDQQAPFHDPDLHEKFCAWLKHNKPDEGVLIGDTVDFSEISRHRHKPEWVGQTQVCLDAGYTLLRDYVDSSLNTHWQKLVGNHDIRIRTTLIDHAMDLYGLRRACSPTEHSVWSIPHLLRLDELGIAYVDPEGEWEQGQVKLSSKLAVRHGWIARKGSGQSALATLEHLGYSVVVGHTHRQSLVHKTTHDIDGNTSTLAGVEAGCMCKIEGGLGYAVAPDWTNGFVTAVIYPDGKFKIDLATYVNGSLFWRDQRY